MAALPLPRSCEPRTVVPATVLTSPASAGQIARTQALKWCWHAAAWRAAKTRPNVSCEGLALGKARALQPRLFGFAKGFTCNPGICATTQGTRATDQVNQPMVVGALKAWVSNGGKGSIQAIPNRGQCGRSSRMQSSATGLLRGIAPGKSRCDCPNSARSRVRRRAHLCYNHVPHVALILGANLRVSGVILL